MFIMMLVMKHYLHGEVYYNMYLEQNLIKINNKIIINNKIKKN